MIITSKTRLICLIVALVFMAGALIGSGTYLIINHINKSNATTSTDYIIEGNLYNTNGTINNQAMIDFLDAIGYIDNPNDTGTYKSYQIATRNTATTSGNTVVFKMGYYTEKNGTSTYTTDLVWQATYLWNGYLTIWMSSPYTTDYFNKGSSDASGWGNDTSYSDYSNYSRSTLRDITNNIYTALSTSLDSFSSFIVSPSEANATWQATQTEDVYTYSSSYYDHHNGLKSYSGKYTGWDQDLWDSGETTSPYNDKFWIPSSVELFNQTSGGSAQTNNGLWGLSAADRGYGTGSGTQTAYDGSTNSSCWLRSGYSTKVNFGSGALLVNFEGSAYIGGVHYSYGIRPAAHISLSLLAQAAGLYAITVKSNNSDYGTVSGLSLIHI